MLEISEIHRFYNKLISIWLSIMLACKLVKIKLYMRYFGAVLLFSLFEQNNEYYSLFCCHFVVNKVLCEHDVRDRDDAILTKIGKSHSIAHAKNKHLNLDRRRSFKIRN